MNLRNLFLIICLSLGLTNFAGVVRDTIDLSGKWNYQLIGAPPSIPGEGELFLPGTLDEAHKSIYNEKSDNTSQLRREFSFVGTSTYYKTIEIPQDWEGKNISLYIERTKPSLLKIDGKEVGYNSRISSPQQYDLSYILSPGSHQIELTVNNADSIPPIIARSSNATSESTQTNWNGILGNFFLEATNPLHIENITIDDNSPSNGALINIVLSQPVNYSNISVNLNVDGVYKESKILEQGNKQVQIFLPLAKEEMWSSNNPNLHQIDIFLTDVQGRMIDKITTTSGFRKFSRNGKHFTVNDDPIFLRGTVNAAVFPLTTYAPLDLKSWLDYFSILKDYGINHVRFHSWTPPEAAFEAADQSGVYIMTELPIWGELDRDLKFHNRFLKEELEGIMESYSLHPSFVMFSNGNELWGDLSLMTEYMNKAKDLNPRILATQGSNVYLGMNGVIGDEDFIVGAKVSDNIDSVVRGSVSFADSSTGGHFNSSYPNSSFNFSDVTKGIDIPVVSHEVGQYQSYPDFSEIIKYNGNLKADNLKEFEKRAIEAGTYRKNKAFKEASGKWAAKLYKAEMESAQRSEGLAGFELFGIQDYPGQGTAVVGILDPFMDSKGFISPEEWRQSSSDLSLFAEFPKFSFTEDEIVELDILTINYTGKKDTISIIYWNTDFSNGSMRAKKGLGIVENGKIQLTIPKLTEPKKVTLTLESDEGKVKNNYDFWIYPKETPDIDNVYVTDNLENALLWLKKGDKVILCPDTSVISKASINPLFITDFWNYRMFRTICDEMNLKPSPGTLGLYINKDHPSLKKFPTDIHTDWQWYPIVANSRPIVIDRLPKDVDPIIEVIDNVERNFRIALMLECNVGKGKLIILSSDIEKASEYPEGKWFLQSIKEYMASKEFKPNLSLTPAQVVNLVTKPSNARLVKELKNETYNSNWD